MDDSVRMKNTLDATSKLADLMGSLRSGALKAVDLWDQVSHAHESHNGFLNAYRTWNQVHGKITAQAADAAFAASIDLGPLQGIPISLKDVYGVRGLPISAGSPRELPNSWEFDGTVVSALRHQLAPISGKTHTVQFAFGGVGTCCHQPTPRNPWDATEHRVPGGSSAGAAVSLHEGSAVIALGTDTAGSVRVPASFGGVVGLKTTAGRWPKDGIVPLSSIFDSPGILTRSVEDLVIAANAIDSRVRNETALDLATREIDPNRFTLGVPDAVFWDNCSAGIVDHVKGAIDELSRRKMRFVAAEVPEVGEAYDMLRQGGTSASELLSFLTDELPEWLDMLDPNVAERVNAGYHITSSDFLSRVSRLARLGRVVDRQFDHVDALVCPTIAITPPTVEQVATADGYREANMAILRNTCVANLLGLCALTIPVGLDSEGMPVGMQLIARANDERGLLALGQAIERIIGTPRSRLGVPPLLQQ